MKTNISDYLPQQDQDAHKPVFRLAPVEDDLTKLILEARRQVIRNKKLSKGARLLFVWLLDISLLWTMSRARGVVVISMTKLAEHLGCSRKSINRWKGELVRGGVIWVDKYFVPNFWALNTYHITAIDPQDQPSQLVTGDGLWGNGTRRTAAPGAVRRQNDAGQSGEPLGDPSKTQEKRDFSPEAGQKGPLSGVIMTPDAGHGCPVPGSQNDAGH